MMEHTPQMAAQSGLAFAVAVVDVGKGEKILSLFREEHALLDYVCMAHGTARTEMLDLLGIGETAKAVVFCLAASGQAQRILNRLGKELQMRYPGRGIAFTIPVSGIGRRWHSLLTQADEQGPMRSAKRSILKLVIKVRNLPPTSTERMLMIMNVTIRAVASSLMPIPAIPGIKNAM